MAHNHLDGSAEQAMVKIGPRPPAHMPELATNPAAVYLATSSSDNTRAAREWDLDKIASLCSGGATGALGFPWEQMKYQHTAAIAAELSRRYAPTTVARMLSSLRGVLKEAWRLGMLDGDTLARATDVRTVRPVDIPPGRALEPGEIRKLWSAVEHERGIRGVRDTAILAAMLGGGLRRGEIVALDLRDYKRLVVGDEDRHAAHVLTVRNGKGHKNREAPLLTRADAAIRDWIEVRGDWAGPLFTHIGVGNHPTNQRITPNGVYLMVRRAARKAGIKHIGPHDLRRTYITALLAAEVDVLFVRKAAGHSDANTTARYDYRQQREMIDQITSKHDLAVPYRRQRKRKREVAESQREFREAEDSWHRTESTESSN